MGVVYEAEQLNLRRRVALKVFPFAAVMDPRHLQRFKNEAVAAAGLDHPHVVRVYGVGCERGVHFIAMQFVDGQTLADLTKQGHSVFGFREFGRWFDTWGLRPQATDCRPIRGLKPRPITQLFSPGRVTVCSQVS